MEAAVEVKKDFLDKLNSLWVERQELLKGRALGLKDALAAAVAAGDITQFTTAAEGVVDALQEKNRAITKQLKKILANTKASALQDPAVQVPASGNGPYSENPAAEPEAATSRPELPANFEGMLAATASKLKNPTVSPSKGKQSEAIDQKSRLLAEIKAAKGNQRLKPVGQMPVAAAGPATGLLAQIRDAKGSQGLKSARERPLAPKPASESSTKSHDAIAKILERRKHIGSEEGSEEGTGDDSEAVGEDEWSD
jgi:hypothetical protein